MKTVNIFNRELYPLCSMDEFQEQCARAGLGDGGALGGYHGKSNLKYGDYWKGGEYHVSGDYRGNRVELIEFKKSLKWGMERKTIWKRHFWSSWF